MASAVLLVQLYFVATAIASTVAYVAQLGPVSRYGQYEDGRDAEVCGPPKPTCCGSCTEHQAPLQVTSCLSSCSEATSDEVAQCCPLTSSELNEQARTYLIVLILASSITVFVALVQLYCAFAHVHCPAELAAPPALGLPPALSTSQPSRLSQARLEGCVTVLPPEVSRFHAERSPPTARALSHRRCSQILVIATTSSGGQKWIGRRYRAPRAVRPPELAGGC